MGKVAFNIVIENTEAGHNGRCPVRLKVVACTTLKYNNKLEAYRSGHNGTDSKSVVLFWGTVGSNPTASAKPCQKVGFIFFAVVFGAMHLPLCGTNPLVRGWRFAFACKHTRSTITLLRSLRIPPLPLNPAKRWGLFFCRCRE